MKIWPPMLRWLRTKGRSNGLRAKIISLGTASPDRVVTQREAYEALGYSNPRTWKIFQNAGIAQRRVWVPPEQLRTLTTDQLYDAYFEGALSLGASAARECLQGHHDVGSLTFASTTQPRLLCPSMSYRLSGALGLPSDMQHTDMIGGGCQGSAPAICRAYDSFVATGRPALVVCAEICSATYFPAPERDLENTVANAIFADGAAACLIGLDDDWRHPWIHSFACEFDPQYLDYLGYRWVDTLHGKRLKVVLHKDVPAIAPIMAEKVVKRLIRAPDLLDMDGIDHFIIHPGGVKVLDNIRDHLKIPESKMGYSREILWEQGNQSSATVGAIGKLARDRALPGDWGLILTLGAGFATYGILLRWSGR
ncbi:MAG: 3-oxoacyl-[acyl-carrier-protein] synthase III C-terminal domain-containing protein [Patescibacteria group bacterium]